MCQQKGSSVIDSRNSEIQLSSAFIKCVLQVVVQI